MILLQHYLRASYNFVHYVHKIPYILCMCLPIFPKNKHSAYNITKGVLFLAKFCSLTYKKVPRSLSNGIPDMIFNLYYYADCESNSENECKTILLKICTCIADSYTGGVENLLKDIAAVVNLVNHIHRIINERECIDKE